MIHDDQYPFCVRHSGKLNEDNGGRRRYQCIVWCVAYVDFLGPITFESCEDKHTRHIINPSSPCQTVIIKIEPLLHLLDGI